MDTHVKALGLLNIIFGGISVLFGLAVFVFFGGPVGLYRTMNDDVLGFLLAGSVVFHMLLAIPCILVGVYLRSFMEWARGFAIVVSALNLLNFPFGCVVGGYGLWVLLTPETDPLFSDRRPRHTKKSPSPAKSPQTSTSEAKPKQSASARIIPSPRS
jgi:hypothetical protein